MKLTFKLVSHEILWKKTFTLYQWIFCFWVFHEMQFQGHSMKHKVLSWNTFTLVYKFHCLYFSSTTTTKCFNSKKMSFDGENLIALVLINEICHSKNKNKNIIKKTKIIRMKPGLKPRNDKSAYVNIYSEVLLTGKEEFRRYLWMNTTSY